MRAALTMVELSAIAGLWADIVVALCYMQRKQPKKLTGRE
jgi:hypothetical protein